MTTVKRSVSSFLSAYVIMSLHYVSVSRFLSAYVIVLHGFLYVQLFEVKHKSECRFLLAYVIVLHGFLYVQLFEVKHRCLVFRYIGGIADHHCLNFLFIIAYLLTLPLFAGVSRVRALSSAHTFSSRRISPQQNIVLPILRVPSVPPVNFQNLPPVKKIKYNKMLTYILRSIFLEIPHLELPR